MDNPTSCVSFALCHISLYIIFIVLLKECISNILNKTFSGPCKFHYERSLSIAIYRYLGSVDLIWIFYPSRRQVSGIYHGPSQVSHLQTVCLCSTLSHHPPGERVEPGFSLTPKGGNNQHTCDCKVTSPYYVLPSPGPRHCRKMRQGRKGGKRTGNQKRPTGEQSGFWATAEDRESGLFMEREMRGIICFQVSERKGNVFKGHWRWGSSKCIPNLRSVMVWEKF